MDVIIPLLIPNWETLLLQLKQTIQTIEQSVSCAEARISEVFINISLKFAIEFPQNYRILFVAQLGRDRG